MFTRLLIAGLVMLGCMPAIAQETVPSSRAQMAMSFAPVVKKVTPAVVNIYTSTKVRVQEASPMMADPFFRQFLGEQGLAVPGRTREQTVNSLGSGVIINSDGVIATSHHVIKDAQEIKVVLSDKREFNAKVLVKDPQSDLALLKVDATGLPSLELRNSDSLEVGDLVLAVGNPFGVGQTVTSGIISALARKAAGVSDYQFFIQTDAAINPGNSGGALVDMDGKLIGINTAIYSKTGTSVGIGFAIPANMVKSLIGSKVEAGKVVRPWVGVAVQPVTVESAESLGLKEPKGAIITRLAPGGAAEDAGLKVGDVVLAVGDTEISNGEDLQYRMALGRIGDTSTLTVLRAGKEIQVKVPLVAPPETPKRDLRKLTGRHPLSGLTVANLSPALALETGLEEGSGVVVFGRPANASSLIVLNPGDVIMEVNGEKITSTAQLEKIMASGSRDWKIVYRRGPNVLTLMVRM